MPLRRLVIAFSTVSLSCALIAPNAGAQVATELPAEAGVRNVKDFGATGDGVTDDTEAILAALASTYNAWEQIYLPAGTYLVSDEIAWKRFTTLRGAGADVTTIRLADGAVGYQDPGAPKAVLFCRQSGRNPGNDNTSHSNYIMNLTVETGAGNAGAVGIDFSAHNGGGVVNVRVVDGGTSLTGLSLERDSPGPAIVRSVEVEGFDSGIRTRYGVYSMTFEDVTVRDQRVTGFYNGQHNATVRGFTSENVVPAITLEDGRAYGLLVLLDAELTGGSPGAAAIVGDGELFARRVTASGYGAILVNGDTRVTGDRIEEFSTSPLLTAAGEPTTSIDLDVPPTPEIPLADASEWVNVRDYADLRDGDDWAPAIQAAIDNGARTLYFPNFTNSKYDIQRDIYLRGDLERVVGLSARFENGRFVAQNTQPLVLEQVIVDQGIVHEGSGALVVNYSLGGSIETRSGAGDLFVEDWCCGNLSVVNSNAYLSQFNNETTESPKISNDGGEIVILNIKTEQSAQVLRASGGAKTEILGGLIYPVQATPTEAMYELDDATLGTLHREVGPRYPNFAIVDGQVVDPPFDRGTRFVHRHASTPVTKSERVTAVDGPGVLSSNETVRVAVDYVADEDRDLVLVFQRDSAPWTVYQVRRRRAPAGEGKLRFSFPLTDRAPIAVDAYQFQAILTPLGGGWDDRIDNLSLRDVDVVLDSRTSSLTLPLDSDEPRALGIAITPNPASERGVLAWQLQVADRSAADAVVTIHDVAGREVHRRVGQTAGRLSTRALGAPGVYLLTAVVNGERATKRFLVE